ncbi:MAG: hypothetical protein JST54_13440 [Deltaproteobacteria bacterium]|nr:hypothetical protein [Deltaproteobacteria bacterium]
MDFRNLDLTCDAFSIGGFQQFGLQLTCTVYGADANGDFVPVTSVQFFSEAGIVPVSAVLSPDPLHGGAVTVSFLSQCPLPVDVSPNAGEYQLYVPSTDPNAFIDACHQDSNGIASPTPVSRTVNPRDGQAALVAFTIGEECYNDVNRNGHFDPGEEDLASCDLGEPFLDENGNGMYDGPGVDPAIPGGEPFFDYDQNGAWTPPNGKWDAQIPIWRSTVITWTTASVFHQAIPGSLTVPSTHCGAASFQFEYADRNGNVPTADSAADSLSIDCGDGGCLGSAVSLQGGFNLQLDSNGLPAATVNVYPSPSCDPNCLEPFPDGGSPPLDGGHGLCPPPVDFTVNVHIDRTLDSPGDGGGTVVHEDYPAVISGTFP